MRKKRNPATDPHPGDVVRYRADAPQTATATVLSVSGNKVTYEFAGSKRSCDLAYWRLLACLVVKVA